MLHLASEILKQSPHLCRLIRLLDRLKSANVLKVVVLVLGMMMAAHWLACIWYMLHKFSDWSDQWGFMDMGENLPSMYLSAFYQVWNIIKHTGIHDAL